MRRCIALLLVLMLTVAYIAFPAAAAPPPEIGYGGNDGSGSSGPVIGAGEKQTFPDGEDSLDETMHEYEAEEGPEAGDPGIIDPVIETIAAMETDPVLETSVETEQVKELLPEVQSEQTDDSLIEELKDAVAAMKMQMIVILLLGVIICMLLLGFVILYARGIIVIRKNTPVRTRPVARVEMREEQPVAMKQDSRAMGSVPQSAHTVKQETWDMRTVKLQDAPKQEELPPIGQTIILRKQSEQQRSADITWKE